MADLPGVALQVSHLSDSVAFFTEKLGFTLIEQNSAEDIAHILDVDGDPLLLAGPAVKNLPGYLADDHLLLKPGEGLNFGGGNNIEAQRALLLSRGATDLQIRERRTGDRILSVRGPDNYSFNFLQTSDHSFGEVLALYASSPNEVHEALAGLSDADMGLTRYDGGWNIRQVVHHIADLEVLFGDIMKVALSSPGAQMDRPRAVGNELTSRNPEYRDRPVDASMALIRVYHEYMLDLVKYIPNAEAGFIEGTDGHKTTFHEMVRTIIRHAEEHVDEIWEIRRKHNK
jgi:catechol 2,3-dioxygenase-like lactoylglutathione lyase family enzyme